MYKEDQGRNLSAATGNDKGSVTAVSSESSLDSFIMGLPGADELPKFASQQQRQSSEGSRRQAAEKPEIKLPTFTRPSHTHIANTSPHSIPDFLYQLTKMLADENTDIIEWNNGRIEVHNPHRLEAEVLHKYFRHSKFASLQRQLNYFGFRKIAGKGKMSPCSYVNESARGDLSSLIYIKRKGSVSGPEPDDKPNRRKASAAINGSRSNGRSTRGNPSPVNVPLDNSNSTDGHDGSDAPMTMTSQQALARSAAGRGIRHGWSMSVSTSHAVDPTSHASVGNDTANERLLQLERNYANCVNNSDQGNSSSSETDLTSLDEPASRPAYGFLSRNSSLVDLAMIPEMEEEGGDATSAGNGMTFVDFPHIQNEANNADDAEAQSASGSLQF